MTVFASECQGISGSPDVFGVLFPIIVPLIGFAVAFLWGWLIHGGGLTIVYSVLCAIARFLRPLFRALCWLYDHDFLILAWLCVCFAVFLSFLTFLVAWNGSPVSFLYCWPLFAFCVSAWVAERLYFWQRNFFEVAE